MLLKLADTVCGDEEIIAMKNVIDSGNYTMGDIVKKFEDEFKQKFGFNVFITVGLHIDGLMDTFDGLR